MSNPGNSEFEELLTERAIRRLIASYPRYADREQFEQAAALYAIDAELVVAGQTIHGRTGIFEWFQSAIKAASRPLGIHFTANTVLENAGDVWEGTTDFIYIRGESQQFQIVAMGRYLDRFRRENGEWRIARRQMASWPGP